MIELSLDELRSVELDILKIFHDFCAKNDIKYYLSNGTLLGAVKYKKFIPWDDDIDVLVPREDYDRLMSLFENDNKYHLFSYERDKKYRFPFAKLCDMTTVKKENGINNGVQLGVDIDIFPIDAWNNDFEKAKKEADTINRTMFFLSLSKLKKPGSNNMLKRVVKQGVMLLSKAYGSRRLVHKIIKKSTQYLLKDSKYCGCKSWCIYRAKEIVPVEVFSDVVYLEFEGSLYPAPIGYDTYLRSLYGDYKMDPPKDKQKTHHNFTAYRR